HDGGLRRELGELRRLAAGQAEQVRALSGQVREVLQAPYRQTIRQVRAVVRDDIPPRATVAVVSRGHEELLKLNGRTDWHVPRAAGGSYAGEYPADSEAAIGHLEV